MNTPIHDVMNHEVVCVPAGVGMDTLEELLLGCDLSGAPVIDGDRRLVGYVAMTDIVREIHDRGDTGQLDTGLMWGFHAEEAPPTVAELMSPVPFELQESCTLRTAIDLMTARRIHHVPVVSDDGILVGLLTAADILHHLAGRTADRTTSRAPEPVSDTERVMSLGFLAGGLAHQINNALTPMRLTLGRLTSFELSRRPMSPEHMHRVELLQDLREELERIARTVGGLTVFAQERRAEAGPVELTEVVESAIALTAHEIRHRARLVRDFQRVPQVYARAADLRQTFVGLLLAAVQPLREGEAHLNEILVRIWTGDDGLAHVEIRDTAGERGDQLVIPVVNASFAASPSEAAPEPTACPGSGDRRRILIVDDDRPVAAAIALELDEHDVSVAESGREALEILRRDPGFDLILCDLMMPEISGMDVYEALRLIEPALLPRFVLMTGGAFTHDAAAFLSSVTTPVLEKPFDAQQLRDLLQAFAHRNEKGHSAPCSKTRIGYPTEFPTG